MEKNVLMGEVCALNSQDTAFNILATYGLETCFGLSIRDKENEVIALGHFDSPTAAPDGVEK